MKPGAGKRKGGQFERTVCKRLSEWMKADEVIFWRSASSGARSTQLAKSGQKAGLTGGDITALDEQGAWLTKYFSIECKTYADFSFDLLLQDKGKIPVWWEQCQLDSHRDDKKPMMIFKKNRSPIYVAFDPISFLKISSYCTSKTINQLSFDNGRAEKSMVILLFEDWLKQVNFELLREIIINGSI